MCMLSQWDENISFYLSQIFTVPVFKHQTKKKTSCIRSMRIVPVLYDILIRLE